MLPHGREYTELEAAFSVQIDSDNENRVTIAGYADLWKWSRGRVARFLGKLGVTIKYDNPTEKLRNQRGHINGHKTDISTQKNGHIIFNDSTDLEGNTDISTQKNGHKTDISADTTIKKVLKNKENIYSPDFEISWKNHPRKDGSKFNAHKKWVILKKKKDFPDIETIIEAQNKQKESRSWREGFVPHFETWLNGRRWEGEPFDQTKEKQPEAKTPKTKLCPDCSRQLWGDGKCEYCSKMDPEQLAALRKVKAKHLKKFGG